jgi:hypothetical protein
MTEEGKDTHWRSRLRWAKCPEPFARQIEAVAALWVEGAISTPVAQAEIDQIRKGVTAGFDQLAESRKLFSSQFDGLCDAMLDSGMLQQAIYEAQNAEQTTPAEREACLRTMIAARNELSGPQR